MKCKICSGDTEYFNTYDFNKNCLGIEEPKTFDVVYHRCKECEFIFTNELDNIDFKALIYNDNYIKYDPDFILTRPKANRDLLISILNKKDRVIDYGGGEGTLSKLMNKRKYNFTSYDPFYGDIVPKGRFDALVSFEVLEHTPNPLATIKDMERFSDIGYLGTLVYTGSKDDWYISPRNGHISIYSYKALDILNIKSYNQLFHRYG